MDQQFLKRWIRATALGWALGVPLIVVLALIGEALGVGGSQVMVGLGMGTGVGLLQARELRSFVPDWRPWLIATTGGLALPFLASDIAALAGWQSLYSLHLSVAVGGLTVGTWQARILRGQIPQAAWWVTGSAIGWSLAGGLAAIADSLSRSQSLPRGIIGALLYLGIVASGGLILGAVTGQVFNRLVLMNQRFRSASQSASDASS